MDSSAARTFFARHFSVDFGLDIFDDAILSSSFDGVGVLGPTDGCLRAKKSRLRVPLIPLNNPLNLQPCREVLIKDCKNRERLEALGAVGAVSPYQ